MLLYYTQIWEVLLLYATMQGQSLGHKTVHSPLLQAQGDIYETKKLGAIRKYPN